MVVLVTGGAGFIGSHVVLSLLENGHEVVVMDNCVNSIIEPGASLPESLKRVQTLTAKKVTFYNVNIMDMNAIDEVFKGHSITVVIHLAALKAVGESVSKPVMYYENNMMCAINLLKAMRTHGVRRFIFSSSATVYGDPNKLPIDEDHETGRNLTNPYGKSKYFTEQMLQDEVTALKMDGITMSIISLRYFNPIGAHESGDIGEDPHGIPNNLMPFISQVAVGRRPFLSVYGTDFDTTDGTGVRDYIHVMDLARGHVSALDRLIHHDNLGWEVFNLGSGSGHSVMQMVEAFEKASGKKIPLQYAPRRTGDVAKVYADCSKAKRVLGWEAEHDLNRMCTDAWRWQEKYPFGFQQES